MQHAALVRSQVAAGAIRAIDTSEAGATPGVLRVVTATDLDALHLADHRFGTIVPDQPILARDVVRHVGEPVAAVVADTAATAVAAAALVRVDIEPIAPLLDPQASLARGAPLIHGERTDNILGRFAFRHGDFEQAEARTVQRFVGTYASPAAQHVTFEPQVVVSRWLDGRLELWAATQSPSRVAAELARVFGIGTEAVRLHVPPLGGGYGAKNHAKLEPLAAALAALSSRPVRLANRRAEEFVTTTKHPAWVRIESGIDGGGRFTFRRASIHWSAGAYAHSSPAVMRAGGLVVCGPYQVPAADVESVMVYTNLPPAGSFRGLGANQAAWAGERQVDEIAVALGEDPAAFRRRNVVRSGGRLPTGERVTDAHWLECLEAAVAGLETSEDLPQGPRRHGTGVALAMKHTMTPSRSEAVVAALSDGSIEVRSSLVDMGQGLRTVLARAAAGALGVPEAIVRVIDPDTAITPFDATTSSSRGAWSGTSAVTHAATEQRRRLEDVGADLLEAPPEAVRLEAARIVRTEAPGGVGPDLAALVEHAGSPISGHGVAVNEAPVDEGGTSASSSHWHQGAVAVQTAVDVETGVAAVTAASGAAWAGRVLDADRARLQHEGGIIFGLGPALFEELAFPVGQPSATTLLDYRVPSLLDTPIHLATISLEAGPDAEPTGIGESLIPAVAPAVASAIRQATGARLDTLPMTPERVLAAIDAARGTEDPAVEPFPIAPPATTTVAHPVAPTDLTAVAPVTGDRVEVNFTVDGRPVTVEATALRSLRAVLAEDLAIRSVRAPCGVGVCGACTVLIDGTAVRSCLRPVVLVDGASVVTSAGVPPDDRVTTAFIAAGAAQCGTCIPGMVLATRALLTREPAPDDAAVRVALAGNLCRCGSYGRILDAVAALSAEGTVASSEGGPEDAAAEAPSTGRSRS
jgi:CO/xanthine dehydrogenase Mo-binding subunit/aerobic-type carbon monoxide dehydrogenase small subunit (CoxS/CutS family)